MLVGTMSEVLEETPRLCPLPALGFIHISGGDAEAFLHNQLSRGIEGLDPTEAPLAAWHDAKGRVRALLRVLVLKDGWLAITHAQPHALVSQLGLFVLRSDVTLANVTNDWQATALVASSAEALEGCLGDHGVDLSRVHGAVARAGDLAWVRIGPGLAQIFGTAEEVTKLMTRLPAGPTAAAELAEIRLGLPEVTPELESRFVPHLLNLDAMGAVVLDKGCYPGQEIIARTENLGAVKRRMLRFSAKLPEIPAPGAQLEDGHGTRQGEIVRAAGQGGLVEFLAVVSLEGAKEGLFIDDDGEPVAVRREPLPYDLP